MKRKGGELMAYGNDRAIKRAYDPSGVKRTSNLMTPIVVLEGHQSDVFGVAFHPEGKYLASVGFDRTILLWNVFGECENISSFGGHSGAVMDVKVGTYTYQVVMDVVLLFVSYSKALCFSYSRLY